MDVYGEAMHERCGGLDARDSQARPRLNRAGEGFDTRARHAPSGTLLRRLRDPLLFGAGVAGVAGVLHVMDPNQPGHYPGCPMLALTGFYCPLCGGLRCVADLTHGDMSDAFARHPLVPLMLAAGLVLWARWLATAVRGRAAPPQLGSRGNRIVLVLAVVFTVLRNIPGWTWLSPA